MHEMKYITFSTEDNKKGIVLFSNHLPHSDIAYRCNLTKYKIIGSGFCKFEDGRFRIYGKSHSIGIRSSAKCLEILNSCAKSSDGISYKLSEDLDVYLYEGLSENIAEELSFLEELSRGKIFFNNQKDIAYCTPNSDNSNPDLDRKIVLQNIMERYDYMDLEESLNLNN